MSKSQKRKADFTFEVCVPLLSLPLLFVHISQKFFEHLVSLLVAVPVFILEVLALSWISAEITVLVL